MQSRMKKYYDNIDDIEEVVPSRAKRNKDLYKEVSNLEIEEFDLHSNVSVLGDNTDNIDINDIKEILTEKYAENKKDKSFGKIEDEDLPEINLDETREYDINSLLSKAKENKEVNYEKERLMKLRDTQYNIFKDIENMQNLEDKVPENNKVKRPDKMTSESELFDLINTITSKELAKAAEDKDELDPLDILSDLKGDDENTKVLGALTDTEEKEDTLETIIKDIKLDDEKEDTKEIEETKEDLEEAEEALAEKNIAKAEAILEDERQEKDKDTEDEKIKETQNFSTNELGDIMNTRTLEIDKSEPSSKTETNKFSFTQNDFDDFNDLREDMHVTKIVLKVLIVVIVLVFIIGCFLLLNKILDWGLF